MIKGNTVTTRECIRAKYRKVKWSEWLKNPNNVYIGRAMPAFMLKSKDDPEPPALKESIFANPYKLSEYTLDECLEKYSNYLKSRKGILKELPTLKGKNLGCFCKPEERCHADILIQMVEKL